MTTLTLELTEEQAKKLADEANRLHVTTEELAAQRLFSPWSDDSNTAPSMAFEQAMEYVLEKNAELYRRLS